MFDTSFLIKTIPLEELSIEDESVRTLKNKLSKSSNELIVFVKSNKVSNSKYFSVRSLFFDSS